MTNLGNGRSLIVRINDRGPFNENRIIDLSKQAATQLGVTGLARVRVQYLSAESEDYINRVRNGEKIDMVAYNDAAERAKQGAILASTEPAHQPGIGDVFGDQPEAALPSQRRNARHP